MGWGIATSFVYVNFNLFAAEPSLSASVERSVTRVAKAGSAVIFNCTLDSNCVNRSIDWTHYSAFDTKPVLWYKRARYNPILESTGVTVEDDPARGWSVLSIPRVRLGDRGRFHCHVFGLQNCQMNFHLTVTGNVCKV